MSLLGKRGRFLLGLWFLGGLGAVGAASATWQPRIKTYSEAELKKNSYEQLLQKEPQSAWTVDNLEFLDGCLQVIQVMDEQEKKLQEGETLLQHYFGAESSKVLEVIGSKEGEIRLDTKDNSQAMTTHKGLQLVMKQARNIFSDQYSFWAMLVLCKHDMVRLKDEIKTTDAFENLEGKLADFTRYAAIVQALRDSSGLSYVDASTKDSKRQCRSIHQELTQLVRFALSWELDYDKKVREQMSMHKGLNDSPTTKQAKELIDQWRDEAIAADYQDLQKVGGWTGLQYENFDEATKDVEPTTTITKVSNRAKNHFKKTLESKSWKQRKAFQPFEIDGVTYSASLVKEKLGNGNDITKVAISSPNKRITVIQMLDISGKELYAAKSVVNGGTASISSHLLVRDQNGYISDDYVKPIDGGVIREEGFPSQISDHPWTEALNYRIGGYMGAMPESRILLLEDFPYWPLVATRTNDGYSGYVPFSVLEAEKNSKLQEEALSKIKYFIWKHMPATLIDKSGNTCNKVAEEGVTTEEPEGYSDEQVSPLMKLVVMMRMIEMTDLHTSNYGAVGGKIAQSNTLLGLKGDYRIIDFNLKKKEFAVTRGPSSKSGMPGSGYGNAVDAFGDNGGNSKAIEAGNPLAIMNSPDEIVHYDPTVEKNKIQKQYFRTVGKYFWPGIVKNIKGKVGQRIDPNSFYLKYIPQDQQDDTIKTFAAIVDLCVQEITKCKKNAESLSQKIAEELSVGKTTQLQLPLMLKTQGYNQNVSTLEAHGFKINRDDLELEPEARAKKFEDRRLSYWGQFLEEAAMLVKRFNDCYKLFCARSGD